MAEPGISLTDADMFPLEVLGSVFNSFGGQLFDQIRSRQGLAYSVSGGWDSPIDHQVRGECLCVVFKVAFRDFLRLSLVSERSFT